MNKDQIVTTSDLQQFKTELLGEIKQIVNPEQSPKRWLKSKEVRKELNISANTLHGMRTSGQLPATKIGGTYFYNYSDIQQMLLQNKQA
nr:helix-turn-helix domain-containing protein [uncultured Carboxylicivirga sp.]